MKNFLVVGASSGIGHGIALELLKKGHQVYGTYFNAALDSLDGGITWSRWDARNPEFDPTFLPDTLDGVVYCPGSISLKPFHRIPVAGFLDDYMLNVGGAVAALQATMERLKKAENPAILLFSTVAVQMGFPFHAQVAASKGAIEGLTRALAAEWAPKIRVNCIAPALTQTPLAAQLLSSAEKIEAHAQRHPLKRIGTVADIASMAAFLLLETGSWITGQVMHVDGGSSVLRS